MNITSSHALLNNDKFSKPRQNVSKTESVRNVTFYGFPRQSVFGNTCVSDQDLQECLFVHCAIRSETQM